MAAFEAAVAMGAAGVELDVRRTADGGVVVHHDAHLADGRAIVELTRDELPVDVPDLADVFALDPSLIVNVEIKSDAGDPDFDAGYRIVGQVIDVIEAAGASERSMITSFDRGAVDPIAKNRAAIRTGWISEELADLDAMAAIGHRVFAPWFRVVTAAFVAEAAERGVLLGTWTVNEQADLTAMINHGVPFVMTDWPDRAVDLMSGGSEDQPKFGSK